MAALDLLRHGRTVVDGRYCGRSDIALASDGWAQMWQAVGEQCWDRIVSSPLRRCAGFSQNLALHLGVECSLDARWQELDFGAWENRPLAALDPSALEAFWRDPYTHAPPGGESLDSLCTRVRAARDALLADATAGERVLVVTHGGPMRVLLSAPGASGAELLGLDVPHAALRACPGNRA